MTETGAEAYWRSEVAAWRGSGQSRGAYCAAHGLSAKTFGWWVWRLEREERQTAAAEPARFLPVEVAVEPAVEAAIPVAAEAGDDRIEIVLAAGLMVRVGAGFDAVALQRVLEVLGR